MREGSTDLFCYCEGERNRTNSPQEGREGDTKTFPTRAVEAEEKD